jgi:hypothetical protein
MSSFTESTNIYVFTLLNGKKKLAYGKSAEDAYNIMKLRLCPEETEQIIKESAEPINPTKISNYIESLG